MHAATTQGKPATTTPFATRAATLGVEPIHGGAWDDLEMRVEVRGGWQPGSPPWMMRQRSCGFGGVQAQQAQWRCWAA